MPLIVTCEDCSTKYRLKDSAAGKILTCKTCANTVLVPASDGLETRLEAQPDCVGEADEDNGISDYLSSLSTPAPRSLSSDVPLEANCRPFSSPTLMASPPKAQPSWMGTLSFCLVLLLMAGGSYQ